MKQILSLLFFLSLFTAQAQKSNTELAGSIKNRSGNPIAFVNIGVEGKGIGCVSDEQGHFRIQIPDTLENELLTVSHLAYKKYTKSISQLNAYPAEIVLEDSLFILPEVSILPSKRKWISSKGIRVPGGVMTTDSAGSQGEEISILIHLKKETVLEKVELPLLKCSYDSVKIRINLYKLDDELRPIPIVPQSLYQTILKTQEKQKITFTYEVCPILQAGTICIAFEILHVYGNGKLVFPLYSSNGLYKKTSLDTYRKSSFCPKASILIRQ